MADVLFENLQSGEQSLIEPSRTLWAAQTFTVQSSEAHEITKVVLLLSKNALGNLSTVTASIRATAGNLPTGADLASGSIDGDVEISTSPQWITINLSSFPSLSSSTEYAIVLRAPGATSFGRILWAATNSGVYTDGQASQSNDSGSNWTAATGFDVLFEEWGTLTSPPIGLFGSAASVSTGSSPRLTYAKLAMPCTAVSASTGIGVLSLNIEIVGSASSVSSGLGMATIFARVAGEANSASSANGAINVEAIVFVRGAAASLSAAGGTLVIKLLADGTTIRLMPFIFNSSTGYVVEFGKEYGRFYIGGQDDPASDAPLMDGASHVEVVTPYSQDD